MSNEKIIRKEVKDYLLKKYRNIEVVEEFGVFLNSRNDVMGVSHDDIISIEIKSDRDTLARLEKQLITYQTFSTIVYVVLDKKHLNKYEQTFSKLFDNIGVLVYNNNKLLLVKEPKRCEFKSLYKLLTSRELTLFFAHFRGKSLIPKDYKTSMYLIENIFNKNEIFKMSKYLFVTRFFRNQPQYVPKELFDDFDVSHKKFKEWLKDENWNFYEYKNHFNWLPEKNKRSRIIRSSLKCFKYKNTDSIVIS